jgi:lipoprotein-releasing system ATP-binding protein
MNSLLEVRNLFKGFVSGNEHLEVLTGLSLDLAQGEMAAVTGVSGSGKSTLLHILGGMDHPDRGSIRFDGKELTWLTLHELSVFRNRTVGFVFQFHHLLPEFTALENVMMPLLLRGISSGEARPTALEMLADVGLEARQTHRPGELSGGEQQRVALARALVGHPRILLADEPTGNLDPHTGEAIGELFHSLHQRRGLTSILVTHNERLARICSRIYRLESGRLRTLDR